MPPSILTKKKIQMNWNKKEHTKDYIQLDLRTDNCGSKDAKVKDHLDL